jgi:taspase (threonine aspartase 1)
MSNKTSKWVIAVHCGAGYHSPKNAQKYKDIMSQACRAASKILVNNTPNACIEAVTQAITILEDCDFTNAGLGSNLTEAGTVECDACISSGLHKSLFGSVGAVMGVKNPIQLAKEIMYDVNRGMGALGRIKPLMLVAHGAWQYCKTQPHCQSIITARNETELVDFLVTEQSKNVWLDHSQRMKQYEEQIYDTVGAVCIDLNGDICAGVSSGGISLKYQGRVGEAAIFGSGCLAEQENEYKFAASCTGVGEDIMYNLVAQKCSQLLRSNCNRDDDDEEGIFLDTCLNQILTESPLIPHHTKRSAGILSLHCDHGSSVELGWGYTTKTMAIGYLSSVMNDAVSFISNNKGDDVQIGIISI